MIQIKSLSVTTLKFLVLGDILADQATHISVCTSFPGGIGMGRIEPLEAGKGASVKHHAKNETGGLVSGKNIHSSGHFYFALTISP
ncbi:MAG TPA: hypothetical protein PKW57_08960 [Anaerolineaceae bacterium]|jgi:hypothetical protein|nr:hypothetical protein [Anaerolineaceae bacterium]HPS33619.1 hypothetical protein [Anaerolineaceae bacterium]